MAYGVVEVEDEGGVQLVNMRINWLKGMNSGSLLSWSLWLPNLDLVNREAWMSIYPDAVNCRFVVDRDVVGSQLKPRLALVALGGACPLLRRCGHGHSTVSNIAPREIHINLLVP